jgi:hypothetical protein
MKGNQMRMLKLFVLSALVLSTSVICAQQQWVTVVPAANQSKTISVSVPPGTAYRFISTNGIATDALTATAAPIPDWDSGLDGNPPDPDPSFPKDFQVARGPVTLNATLTDAATMPATVTTKPVNGLAYPPITFTPNVSYTVSVSNIPPATTTSPLQGTVTIQIGDTLVQLVCTYATTLANGASLAAVFTCLPVPIPVALH